MKEQNYNFLYNFTESVFCRFNVQYVDNKQILQTRHAVDLPFRHKTYFHEFYTVFFTREKIPLLLINSDSRWPSW